MQFHERLKVYRKERGLTQEELAQKIYVSRSAVAKWENGIGLPNNDSLDALAAVFGVKREELLADRGTETIFVRSQIRKRRHYSLVNIVIPLIFSCIYILLSVGTMYTTLLVSVPHRPGEPVHYLAFFLLFLLYVLPPLVFGLSQLILAVNRIRYRVREGKAERSKIHITATIVGYRAVNYIRRRNKRFSFILSYEQDGKQRKFVTKALFDINEFNYLSSLDQVQIAVDGKVAFIDEPFPEDLYINPKYETKPTAKQSAGIIILRIVNTLCVIALLFAIASVVAYLQVIGNYNALILAFFVAPIVFAAVHIPSAIFTLCCLISRKLSYI